MTRPLPSPVVRPPRAAGTGGVHRAVLLAAALTTAAGLAAPVGAAPSPAPLERVVVAALEPGAAAAASAADAVRRAGGTVLHSLPLVGGVAAELPAGAVLAPGLHVAPDRPVQVATSGGYGDGPASPVRETLGLGAPAGEGAGITVAVVDTGVAPSGDLAGRLTQVDVTGTGSGDGYGHGTFVAGLVAGSGAASDGRYAGVAPGARVLSVRVADAEGRTDLLTVLRGLEAAASRGAHVVNLSLSSYSPLPYQLDPLTVALGALWQRGTVVVVPAGNDGPDAGTVTSPGVHPALLTVGSLAHAGTAARADDAVSSFSARGPAPQDVAKPDVVAPGQSVVSLRAPGSVVDVAHGGAAAVGADYFRGSGTSFATAVASGAAAALLAERRLSPDQVKGLLETSSYELAGGPDPTGAGAGGVDLAAARTAPLPDVTSPVKGNGRRLGAVKHELGVPGRTADWLPLVRAVLAGDAATAASSWSRLPAEAKAWAASSWSALPADLRAELVAQWAQRNWAHLPADQWALVDWAQRNWAASSWSQRNWAASSWSQRNWAETQDDWLAGWATPEWAQRNWAQRNWAQRNWAASSWSQRNWAQRNWAASSWSQRNWAASSWAASSWSASSWAAAAWGS